MDHWVPYLLLFIIGLTLFFLEAFIPSAGVLGIGASLCILYSLWALFRDGHTAVGVICIVSAILYGILLVRWWLRRVRMDTSLAGGVATGADVRAAEGLIGEGGETVTALRPSGIARIHGQRFDVVTRGDFLPPGTSVTVVEASGNRIVVRAARRT
ncbi:MAG: NfeD family protein [Planctomycetota bacterium]